MPFSVQEVTLIREIVRDCSGLSRMELARTVCELLRWRRPNGRLKAQGPLDRLGPRDSGAESPARGQQQPQAGRAHTPPARGTPTPGRPSRWTSSAGWSSSRRLAARGRSLFAEPACSGSLAMSD